MDSIAWRLAHARKLRDLSQDDLAKAAEVRQSTVGNIESGRRNGFPSLPKLASALGVRHEWLRYGDEPMEPQSAQWPFPGIEPARLLRLSHDQRLEVQGAVRTVIAELEKRAQGGELGGAIEVPIPHRRKRNR